jgi:glycosyltransferase involved in cell wall biosynthesis
MKIFIPNVSSQKLGGGFTALRNLKKGLGDLGCEFVNSWPLCDVVLIVGVSMTDMEDVEEAKKAGKKIVFRVDNIPRKSRNKRGRVYSKMKRLGELADKIVYQSRWAQKYAEYLIGYPEKSCVIYNGVDQSIFYPASTFIFNKYLFVQFNRDDNKRYGEALYYFHMLWRKNKKISLTLVGQFSPELVEADFDFFDGENFTYIPPIENPEEMAEIYRQHAVLLFPAFCDAAPNTVLEARACGLDVELVNPVGGTKEMLDKNLDISLERMSKEYACLLQMLINK